MLLANLHTLFALCLRLVLKTGFAVTITLSYFDMLHRYPLHEQRRLPAAVWLSTVLHQNHTFCTSAAVYGVPVALSFLCQLCPALSTWVRSWTGLAKSFVDICEPLNRLLVGKARRAHGPCDTDYYTD